MSLIDEFDNKVKNDEIKKVECKNCHKELINTTQILLCESCFNESMSSALKQIKTTLAKINEEITKVDNSINKIKEGLNDTSLNIIVLNKLEIDLLNFIAIRKKLEIDKDLNQRAYELNQVQANKLRQVMNWTLFDVQKLGEN